MKDFFKVNNSFRKFLPLFLIMISVMVLMGTSYALLKSTNRGTNTFVMNVGVLEITFQDSETNTLTLSNMIPESDEEGLEDENELVFTVKNTGTLPATYSVYIEETSTSPEFKTVLRYASSKNDADYTDPKTLSEDKYIDTNATLGVNQTATYKVKVWLSIDADSTYMDKTFTARIVVDTNLNYDGFVIKDPILGVTLASYEEASSDTFTGGLIAVNTDGTLYNETDTNQAIREYRYSGATANNYIKFNNGEMWRIVGMFKNSAGEWNLKLMRNTMLTSDELPSTYTYNGTSYTIEKDTTGNAYWNYTNTATNYNDWTTAGLQYYLNGTDGYFGTLSNGAQLLVDTNYVYYLGNVSATYYSEDENDTAITAYENERKSTVCGSGITSDAHTNNCDIWYGNKATWNSGKGIALLYPSDYGYSADSSYWNTIILWDYNGGPQDTSWMQTTANHSTIEWFLSPSSSNSNYAAYWSSTGFVNISGVAGDFNGGGVRPVLNLKSTATIDTNHQGTESDPYIVVE